MTIIRYIKTLLVKITNPLLLVFTCFLMLTLGEIIVRNCNLSPQVIKIAQDRYQLSPNPKIGYEPIPNIDSKTLRPDYNYYQGKSNNLGFRDFDRETKKPEGVFRILVLGDSVTLGLWIENDRLIFTSKLEEEFNKRGKRIEVLNFAAAGYNTLQEIETLKDKGLAFKPDLVILAFCQNDRFRDDGGIHQNLLNMELSGNKLSKSRFSPYLVESALYRLIAYRLLNTSLIKDLKGHHQRELEVGNADTVEGSLFELAQLSKEHNFRTSVVLLPLFSSDGKKIQITEEYEKLKSSVTSKGMDFFNLSAAMEGCDEGKNSSLAFDYVHLTLEGHRCASRILYNYYNIHSFISYKR